MAPVTGQNQPSVQMDEKNNDKGAKFNENLARILEQYVGDDRKHSFSLKNGHEYFGWLSMEYDETGMNVDYSAPYLLFLWSGSPIDESSFDLPEEKVMMEDIDLNSLAYWDYNSDSGWVEFTVENYEA